MNDELIDLIKEVEDKLVHKFNNPLFVGSVLRSSIEQIEDALGQINNKNRP